MDLETLAYTLADPDYYLPLERCRDQSRPLRPTNPPPRWKSHRRGVWVSWDPPAATPLPEQGWKIHISATLAGAPRVLDEVTEVCAGEAVPFKHLASEFAFLFMGHKHGSRPQAGKFCTLYPPDQQRVHRLLAELADRLASEDGPYILSDRRFADSRTVHYRYGAFRSRVRVELDGTSVPLIRDGSGEWVDDVRTSWFVLPEGVSDPFLAAPVAEASTDGGVMIGSYRVTDALAQSNAGGAYRATEPAGREVFMKEARSHTGFHWDGSTAPQRLRREHQVLCELHAKAPGLAPEPVELFREWEHEFLVTELVPGSSLFSYAALSNPYIREGTEAEFEAYFRRCLGYLTRLAQALERLHELGYRFGDVNPRNILVTEDGGLRLIDFEACSRLDEPPIGLGAPGYVPTDPRQREGTGVDDYGLSAVALTLLAPVHQQLARNPAAMPHVAAQLHRRCPVPPQFWQLAVRHLPGPADPVETADEAVAVPTPEQFAADPRGCLRTLREAIGRELTATATPDDPDQIWPTVPAGYATNTWNVAYGAAGVMHALHHAGLPADPKAVDRLGREGLARRAELPPGLHYGLAGVAAVLGEYGRVEESRALVDAARDHPLTATSGTWGSGSAGVGTALLVLHTRTGADDLLAGAAQIGDALIKEADPVALIGHDNPTGLLHGRAGIALFLHQLWRATGEQPYLHTGRGLLHAELALGTPVRGMIMFPDDDETPRLMPYLEIGSAGVGMVLNRYYHAGDADERLAAALGPVFAGAHQPITIESGLFRGLAGLAFAHAEHADRAGAVDPAAADLALRLAAGLVAYVSPGPDGRARVLGLGRQRFSCDLGTGAAGVLLALDRVLAGPSGQLFTIDGQ